jgi:DNA-binding SARP family transcriptional activator
MHLEHAQAAAEQIGDKATVTLIEMLQHLCLTRSGLNSEPGTSIKVSEGGQAPVASLSVHLFGTFQAFLNGTVINGWRKKSESLFKYLIVHRTVPVHREKLFELFWPDLEAHSARNCLNVTLHGLRQNLQLREAVRSTNSLVQFANDHYYLHPRLNVWTDTEAFTNYITLSQLALQRGAQAEALSYYEMAAILYRGHFLENDYYEEWTMRYREHLKTTYLNLLAQQSLLYFASKNYTTALERSRKILEYDQCNEEAHCQIMRCSYALGRRGLALHQYQVLCDILSRELGMRPMDETIHLYEEMKNGSFHPHSN